MPSPTTTPRPRLTLRVDLDGVASPVWRVLSLDAELGLNGLAEAILLAFGWTGTGTWRFGTKHTPWWGRDADAWAYGALTPARYGRHPRPSHLDDDWRGPQSDGSFRGEWTVGEVADRFDGRLEFEYRQLGLNGEHGEPGPAWRHHITITEPDGASSRSSLGSAVMLGGVGRVPRTGGEAAYGELADPDWHQAIGHEFDRVFGESTASAYEGDGRRWISLDAAITGASEAAGRALRIDLARLGALTPSPPHPDHVAAATAPIRDLLRTAAAPDGIDFAESGPLGNDLKELRFARVQKGRLRTYAHDRDQLLDDPAALWSALAERMIGPGYASARTRQPEIAELAVNLALGDRGHGVRRFAFDEAYGRSGRRLVDSDLDRVKRVLATMGLTDDEGRAIHPAAPAFGFAMLQS